jgi:nucleoporin NUP42
MRNALHDVDGAINFIHRAQNEHPNRVDVCESSMKNPGQPLFGQSSTGASQVVPAQNPSSMNTGPPQPGGIFGQRDPFSTQSAFGQPSRLGSTGTFGQPSTLGQKSNPFGTGLGGATSHGPAPFSSFAGTPNPFGGPPQPIGSNPLGPPSQSAQPAQLNPFNQAASAVGPNLFSQVTTPSLFTQAAAPSPFSQASASLDTDPFGHLRQSNPFRPSSSTTNIPNANTFGRTVPPSPPPNPNPFGQPTAIPPANPFGQQPGIQNIPSVNASSSAPRQTESVANGISVNGPYAPSATLKHPPLQSYSSQDASQRLIMFRGKPVVYKGSEAGTRNRDGSWEKIWFPNGPPAYYRATEMDDDTYSEGIKAVYLHLRETGEFQGGIMPFLPPKREWCLWDF